MKILVVLLLLIALGALCAEESPSTKKSPIIQVDKRYYGGESEGSQPGKFFNKAVEDFFRAFNYLSDTIASQHYREDFRELRSVSKRNEGPAGGEYAQEEPDHEQKAEDEFKKGLDFILVVIDTLEELQERDILNRTVRAARRYTEVELFEVEDEYLPTFYAGYHMVLRYLQRQLKSKPGWFSYEDFRWVFMRSWDVVVESYFRTNGLLRPLSGHRTKQGGHSSGAKPGLSGGAGHGKLFGGGRTEFNGGAKHGAARPGFNGGAKHGGAGRPGKVSNGGAGRPSSKESNGGGRLAGLFGRPSQSMKQEEAPAKPSHFNFNQQGHSGNARPSSKESNGAGKLAGISGLFGGSSQSVKQEEAPAKPSHFNFNQQGHSGKVRPSSKESNGAGRLTGLSGLFGGPSQSAKQEEAPAKPPHFNFNQQGHSGKVRPSSKESNGAGRLAGISGLFGGPSQSVKQEEAPAKPSHFNFNQQGHPGNARPSSKESNGAGRLAGLSGLFGGSSQSAKQEEAPSRPSVQEDFNQQGHSGNARPSSNGRFAGISGLFGRSDKNVKQEEAPAKPSVEEKPKQQVHTEAGQASKETAESPRVVAKPRKGAGRAGGPGFGRRGGN